jgi:hypothetical protein
MPTPTYVALSKTIVATPATSLTISGIPQTYDDLLIITAMRSTYPGLYTNFMTVRWNGDSTGSLYSDTSLYGTGSAVSSTRQTAAGRNYPFYINADLSTSNVFSNGEIYVPNYTTSSNKVITSTGIAENNSTTNNFVYIGAGLYTGTSAITSIVLLSNGGTPGFDVGSRIDIYGIKRT